MSGAAAPLALRRVGVPLGVLWLAFVLAHLYAASVGWFLPALPMGDTVFVYEPWATAALGGGPIVGITESWVYPQLALRADAARAGPVAAHPPAGPGNLPVGSASYVVAWSILVTALDAVGFAFLLAAARASQPDPPARRLALDGRAGRARTDRDVTGSMRSPSRSRSSAASGCSPGLPSRARCSRSARGSRSGPGRCSSPRSSLLRGRIRMIAQRRDRDGGRRRADPGGAGRRQVPARLPQPRCPAAACRSRRSEPRRCSGSRRSA